MKAIIQRMNMVLEVHEEVISYIIRILLKIIDVKHAEDKRTSSWM
jgi:acetolactate synthase small subunit